MGRRWGGGQDGNILMSGGFEAENSEEDRA